ncbi:MAG: Uma2 family endonuclease [Acidobacteriota bacterium]
MGAKTAITVEQYLQTSFPDIDKEYWDGKIVERSLPDNPHSATQALLIAFFMALRKTLHTYPRPELRLKLSDGLFRIPDVSVFHPHASPELVPTTPPLIAIEILSPDDRMTEVHAKLEEYSAWGVPHVWLVDPQSKRMYSCDPVFTHVQSLRVPELNLELTAADIFE